LVTVALTDLKPGLKMMKIITQADINGSMRLLKSKPILRTQAEAQNP